VIRISYVVCRRCGGFNRRDSAFCGKCYRFLPRRAHHEVELPERRAADRREMALVGAVLRDESGPGEPIFIENLGMGGLRFRADVEFTAGNRVRVVVPVDGQQFIMRGIVRHCGTDTFGPVIGIQFIDPLPEFTQELQQLCMAAGAGSELVFA
jgi:hypothetical protein